MGEICVKAGFTGAAIEILASQNPGLLVNLALATTILAGAVIYAIPEYKGKN